MHAASTINDRAIAEVLERKVLFREFTKGGLIKRGLAIYVLALCNCNTLGSAFDVQIENMPNC